MSEALRFALIGSNPEAISEVKSILVKDHGFTDIDTLIDDKLFNPQFSAKVPEFNPVEQFKKAVTAIKANLVTAKISRLIVARTFAIPPLSGKIIAVTKGQTKEELVVSLNGNSEPILDHFEQNPGLLAARAESTIDIAGTFIALGKREKLISPEQQVEVLINQFLEK